MTKHGFNQPSWVLIRVMSVTRNGSGRACSPPVRPSLPVTPPDNAVLGNPFAVVAQIVRQLATVKPHTAASPSQTDSSLRRASSSTR